MRAFCPAFVDGAYNSNPQFKPSSNIQIVDDLVKLDYAVIGIGVNVNFPKNGFPKELDNIAASINSQNDNNANTKSDIRNVLVAKILENLYDYYFNDVNFYEEYKKRSFLIGKKVSININNKEHIVKVLDIDKTFALIIEFHDGKVDRLVSGSINYKLS